MRLAVAFAALLLCVATPGLAAPVESPAHWILWSDDGADDPVGGAPGDIDSIQAGVTATDLHLELTTFPSQVPAGLASSRVDFVPTDSNTVRFLWDSSGPRLFVGSEEKTEGWQVADGSGPFGWHVQIRWDLIGIDPSHPFSLKDLDAATSTYAPRDSATGPDLSFAPASGDVPQLAPPAVPSLKIGDTVEGPDYAGGASVAVNGAGDPLVAYYVYDESRGTSRGIYLAHVQGGRLVSERLSGTAITRAGGRDEQMRTQVAYDGKDTFVLYTDRPATDHDEDGPGDPGVPDSVYVLAKTERVWAPEDPTPGGDSNVSAESVPDLAARDGHLVAAVPVGHDVWVVERAGPGKWQVLHRIGGATNAKLALDSRGGIHVAYAVYDAAGGRYGKVFYASSADDYRGVLVGDNIDAGWEGPETDGSYAIAVAPNDDVAVLWNDGRSERGQEQRVAVLSHGQWKHDFAPLTPGHGNPQYTMRLGFTADGAMVASSGYGGTDMLAVRGPAGWASLALDRYDVWDMAVAPSGTAFFAYTQPHGGTTLAVTAFGTTAGSDVVAAKWLGGLGRAAPGAGSLSMVALAIAALALRQRRPD